MTDLNKFLDGVLPPEVEQWQGGEVSREEMLGANHMRRKCKQSLIRAFEGGEIVLGNKEKTQ